MRLSDTFLGYGQAPDMIRKQQVENPFTMPHMISETSRVVKEYNDTRKYAVELYTDVFLFLLNPGKEWLWQEIKK